MCDSVFILVWIWLLFEGNNAGFMPYTSSYIFRIWKSFLVLYRSGKRGKLKQKIQIDVFVRATLHMRRVENPTRYHWMLYCTYYMLNMFRALLCSSSGAPDYMCVITSYGVQFLVAGCRGSGVGQQALRPARGCCTTVSCSIPLPGRTACCSAPDLRQPATKHCTP